MKENKEEHIHKLKQNVMRILDGNWTNQDNETLEIIEDTQNILIDSVSALFALLFHKNIITKEEIKEFCATGWRYE